MSIKIWGFALWTSAADAKEYGCTHHARIWGILPGFWNHDQSLWVPRSDLFGPIEDGLNFIAGVIADWRDDDPMFMFAVGKKIR